MKDKDILEEAKERFKQAETAEQENRDRWVNDVRFARLGEQWPEKLVKDREIEGRPCLTINRIPAFIRQVVNDARQNTPQITFHANEDGDEDTAKILDGLVKNIEYVSNADVAYDTALDHAVSGGFGYFRVVVGPARDDSWNYDILIKRVANPLTVYGDPMSTESDASDWRFGFITELIPKDEFEKRWKAGDKVDWQAYGDAHDATWLEEDNVRVAEYWKREEVKKTLVKCSDGSLMDKAQYEENAELFALSGITIVAERETSGYKVTQYILTGSEILETNDWHGRYIPIIPVYGDETFIDGKRVLKSIHHDAHDAQRQYNYWRTTATELIALAPRVPFIGPKGAFMTDAARWATANKVSHPYLEYDGATPPQRQPLDSGGGASSLQQAISASEDMKSIMGLHDASLGAKSNETSGKAILLRQREGDVSTFNFIDNLTRAIRYCGVVIADLIPAVYNEERIIRVIGNDGSEKAVAVNKPHVENGVEKIYDLTSAKYDISVKAGPSFTTRREEAASQMLQMIQAFPQAAQVMGDLLAKNLDWPGAEQIAARLRMMLPPAIQKAENEKGIPPEAQMIMAQMDSQMKQMQEQMKQGMQMLESLTQENKMLKLENANKEKQIEVDLLKAKLDSQTKLEVAAMKTQSQTMPPVQEEPQMPTPTPAPPVVHVSMSSTPRRKKMTLQAPSGAIYQGMVEDDDPMEDMMDEMGGGIA